MCYFAFFSFIPHESPTSNVNMPDQLERCLLFVVCSLLIVLMDFGVGETALGTKKKKKNPGSSEHISRGETSPGLPVSHLKPQSLLKNS